MTEIFAIYAFLRARLAGNPNISTAVGNRIYADAAPSIDDATKVAPVYPMVVFGVRVTKDQTVIDGESAYLDAITDVKIITDDSLASIADLDAAVFGALHRSGAQDVDNVHIMGCHREGHILTQRIDGDKNYRYSIQTYRLRASRTS